MILHKLPKVVVKKKRKKKKGSKGRSRSRVRSKSKKKKSARKSSRRRYGREPAKIEYDKYLIASVDKDIHFINLEEVFPENPEPEKVVVVHV